MNRACFARTPGDDGQPNDGQPEDNNTPGNNNPPDDKTNHSNGGGPVSGLGASPYYVNNHGPSDDDHPNHGVHPLVAAVPETFVPAPEPGYMGVAGLALVAVWMLTRKRRIA